MARITMIAFITDGQLTAARNVLKDGPLDPQGGGLEEFSVDMRNTEGGGPPGWNACAWRMLRNGLGTISFEQFKIDVIDGLNMQHNTGGANTQIATYISEDDFPGLTTRQAFEAARLDTVKKPHALERVPQI